MYIGACHGIPGRFQRCRDQFPRLLRIPAEKGGFGALTVDLTEIVVMSFLEFPRQQQAGGLEIAPSLRIYRRRLRAQPRLQIEVAQIEPLPGIHDLTHTPVEMIEHREDVLSQLLDLTVGQ